MQYFKFKADDEKGINKFLKENTDKLVESGVRMVDGMVCFLVSNDTLDEQKKAVSIEALKKKIFGLVASKTDSASAEEYYKNRAENVGGEGNKYGELIKNEANNQREFQVQIDIAQKLLHDIEKGSVII